MNVEQKEKLIKLLGSNIVFQCPMAEYTTLKIGGEAEALCTVNSIDILTKLVSLLAEEHISYMVLGWGSNLIVKDQGVEGAVIVLRGALESVDMQKDGDLILKAGAGCRIKNLLHYCREKNLGGIEFLAGIPGTVGGAVAMNAGAFGKEIGEKVVRIDIMDQNAKIETIKSDKLKFSYRSCDIADGGIIVGCYLCLEKMTKRDSSKQTSLYLTKRKKTQPLEYPSAGSVFKNPPGEYAGRLIEISGLKGKKIGGAMISKKHANFIINTGKATAKDVLELICLIRETVNKKTGILLETEIKIVGN